MPATPSEDSDIENDTTDFTEEDIKNSLDALSLRNQRKQIRHELTDPYNRLHSIALDAHFVQAVSEVYPDFAVVPWYVNPHGATTVKRDVYFKSIDGHAGQWNYPLRRPNLPFLDIIIDSGGAIIVDSTRRGKRFPDALSKTVPIWCAVINRAFYKKADHKPQWSEDDLDIHTASASVGESERDQIRSRLDRWAVDLLGSSYTLPNLSKPLRPLHISPSSRLPDQPLSSEAFENFYPVICLSASRYTSGGSSERFGTFNYVPGSGDDHEGWVPSGFGPQHFWDNKKEILDCDREELYSLMERLALGIAKSIPEQKEKGIDAVDRSCWIAGTNVGYCNVTSGVTLPKENVHYIPVSSNLLHSALEGSTVFSVPQEPKKHLSYFSAKIEGIQAGISSALAQGKAVQVMWPEVINSNEKDFGIGIMLVALTLHFDNSCQYVDNPQPDSTSKATVNRRLEWIITASNGSLNPSKKILKRVNDYLFSR